MSDTQVTVTSENLDAFNADKLGIKPDEPKAEKVEPKLDTVEPEIDTPDEPKEEEPKKPKSSIQDRFSKLTADRDAAQRRAEQAERERDELKAKVTPKEEPKEDPTKPKAADFKDAFEYAEALADWRVDQKLREREETAAREKVVDGWKSRVAQTKAEMPDYDDVIGTSSVSVSNDARDAIIESEYGPKVLYALASDDELAAKFAAMSPKRQLIEIGRLETRFEKIEAQAEVKLADIEPPKRKPPPEPIKPVKGGRPVESLNDVSEFNGSFAQYKAARMRERA